MRKHTIPMTIAGLALTALALTACSTAAPTGDKTPTAKPTAATVGGVADTTGKCVDGQATPTNSKKTITIGDCDLIDVMGSNNTITAGATKHLVIEGSGNTVTVKATTEVTTLGKDNVVKYEGDEPTFNERSSGNSIEPKAIKK